MICTTERTVPHIEPSRSGIQVKTRLPRGKRRLRHPGPCPEVMLFQRITSTQTVAKKNRRRVGSPAGRGQHRSALRGSFDRLVRRHVVISNPTALVKGIKGQVRRRRRSPALRAAPVPGRAHCYWRRDPSYWRRDPKNRPIRAVRRPKPVSIPRVSDRTARTGGPAPVNPLRRRLEKSGCRAPTGPAVPGPPRHQVGFAPQPGCCHFGRRFREQSPSAPPPLGPVDRRGRTPPGADPFGVRVPPGVEDSGGNTPCPRYPSGSQVYGPGGRTPLKGYGPTGLPPWRPMTPEPYELVAPPTPQPRGADSPWGQRAPTSRGSGDNGPWPRRGLNLFSS